MRSYRFAVALAVCTPCTQTVAHAQTGGSAYPTKPIRMIVPFAVGGASDAMGPVLSAKLSERLKQQVLVDNRTEAGGAIGTELEIVFAKSGRLRALGVSSAKRWPSVPEYPTVAESGVPGFGAILWTGILAPAGTPREIVAQLERETAALLTLPDVKELLAKHGAEINSAGAEQFAGIIRRDSAKWAKLAREANIRIE